MAGQPRTLDLSSQQAGTGMQWQLPRRTWGAGWYVPYIVMGVGITMTVIFGFKAPDTLPDFNKDPIVAVFDLVWLVGVLLGMLIGTSMVIFGLALRNATTTVTLSQKQISSTDRFGPLRWTRRLDAAYITGFEINVGTSRTNGGPEVPMENVTMLIAQTDQPSRYAKATKRKHDFIIAWGYPKAWMQQLVDALTEEAESISPKLADLETTTTFGSGDGGEGQEKETRVAPPEKTRVILRREPDGLTINIPPKGIVSGSKGLAFFTVLWNGFIVLTLGFTAFAMLTPNNPNTSGPDSPWVLLIFVPFIAVGVGLAVFCLHAGKSRVSLVVIGSGEKAVLAYIRNSPVLKTREKNWLASDLSHICIGDSNMSINDVPVQELQVHPKRGSDVGLLAQLDHDEIRWIAYELRQQMGLRSRAIFGQP